jgi:hypothetical protein
MSIFPRWRHLDFINFKVSYSKIPRLRGNDNGIPMCWLLAKRVTEQGSVFLAKFFLSFAIFNYLLGNRDAHAKSIGFLYPHPNSHSNKPTLTPLRNLVCHDVRLPKGSTPDDTRPGIVLNGARTYGEVRRRTWETLGDEMELSPVDVRDIALSLSANTRSTLPGLAAEHAELYGGNGVYPRIVAAVTAKCDRLEAMFGHALARRRGP